MVRRIEPRGERRALRPCAEQQSLADALVAEPCDDDVEPAGVGLAEIREPRPLPHELDLDALAPCACRVAHVAQHDVAVVDLVLDE